MGIERIGFPVLAGLGFVAAWSALGAGAAVRPPVTGPAAWPEPIGASVEEVVAASETAASLRRIDLAICLDTSGSMEGLIDAARQKLWDIVNDLALATPTPDLRVALLTFGNDGHVAENGWVRVDVPFTDDLDLVSRELFALTTNGGTELVGRVLHAADEQLDWTPSEDSLKLIVVAGNESADQDAQRPFRDVCRRIIGRGIMVNSIYCGNPADELAPAWREVATLADGHFAAIDQQNGTVVVATPFDDELARLSAALNETYIPYGEQGAWYAMNQTAQDANVASMNTAAAAARCQTKAGDLYRNEHWDLVDACAQEGFDLAAVKEEELPEAMRGMTVEQRHTHVAAMATKRAELRSQVDGLAQRRQTHVEAEMAKLAGAVERSFDVTIRKAVRAQAVAKGFEFKETASEAGATDGGNDTVPNSPKETAAAVGEDGC